MIFNPINIILLTFVLVFAGTGVNAQKKKKPVEEVQASGTRHREAEFFFTEGEKFFILEDYAKALSYYEKTLEIAPENATVHYKIAEVLAQSNRQEDLQRASTSIDNALRLEKKNKYFYLLAANIYTSLARFDRAAQIYEALIKEVPNSHEYLYELAAVYQFWNKYDQALATYDRAEKALGVNEVSSLQKQKIYLDQGKLKEAIVEGEKLLAAYPGEERLLMAFTEFLSQRGLKQEAIGYLEKFVKDNPDAFNSRMLLAAFYRESNQESRARPILLTLFDHPDVDVNSKLLILGAYNAELNLARGRNQVDEEKFAFAEKLFAKLIESSPNGAKVHIVGGDLYLAAGKFDQARAEYLNALKNGDVTFEVWQNILQLDYQMEDYSSLVKHADQALEIFPNQGILYYFSGTAQLKSGQPDEAIAMLSQAKRLSGANARQLAEINARLGEAFHVLGNVERSDRAFEEALAGDGETPEVLNMYASALTARKSKLDRAEQIAETLARDYPGNAAYLSTYSNVLYTRGKYKEARKVIEKAIASGSATAVHLEQYGDILYKLGEVDAAVMQWEKARGMNANNELLNRKIANRKIYE